MRINNTIKLHNSYINMNGHVDIRVFVKGSIRRRCGGERNVHINAAIVAWTLTLCLIFSSIRCVQYMIYAHMWASRCVAQRRTSTGVVVAAAVPTRNTIFWAAETKNKKTNILRLQSRALSSTYRITSRQRGPDNAGITEETKTERNIVHIKKSYTLHMGEHK